MDGELKVRSDILAENASVVASKYKLDYRIMALGGAFTFLNSGATVDADLIEKCRDLMKSKLKLFSGRKAISSSTFLKCAIACKMSQSMSPEDFLDDVNCAWGVVRKYFTISDFMGNAAFTLASCCKVDEYDAVVSKAKEIYKLNKKKHFFITNGKDISECILQAMCSQSAANLVDDSEACYKLLKKHIRKSDAVQSIAFISAMFVGTNEEKCDKIVAFYKKLKEAKVKLSVNTILPSIAVPALCDMGDDSFINDIKDIEQYLKKHKSLRGFCLSKQQRYQIAMAIAMTTRMAKVNSNIKDGMLSGSYIFEELITSMMVEQVLETVTMVSVTTTAAAAS